MSVTTITKEIVDGFAPHLMGKFLGEREDQVRVLLRSVEGCGSNGQKTPLKPRRLFTKPANVYQIAQSKNSELADRKIASLAKC